MSNYIEIGHFVMAEGEGKEVTVDSEGIVTHSPFLPETAEIIYGGLSSIIIFFLLAKFAGPALKKGLAKRTDKIQGELDGAAAAKTTAAAEAQQIRTAKGDINAERERLLAEADEQAAVVIADGRIRLDDELAEMETRATADIASAASRVNDELRAEIVRMTSLAAERAVVESLDDATQQQLIESFIQKVGASA